MLWTHQKIPSEAQQHRHARIFLDPLFVKIRATDFELLIEALFENKVMNVSAHTKGRHDIAVVVPVFAIPDGQRIPAVLDPS